MRSPGSWRARASRSSSPCPAFSSIGRSTGCARSQTRSSSSLRATSNRPPTWPTVMPARAARSASASVVPGPGVLNAMAGLSTAYACNSRVLCIAGDIVSSAVGRGLGLLHEVRDQSGILSSVTKWQSRATRAEEVPKTIADAFAQLRSAEPKPVAVEISQDVLSSAAEFDLLATDLALNPARSPRPNRSPQPRSFSRRAPLRRSMSAAARWRQARRTRWRH